MCLLKCFLKCAVHNGWRGSSVSHQELSWIPRTHVQMANAVAHTCNPWAGEPDVRGCLWLASKSICGPLANARPFQKSRWKALEEQRLSTWSHASVHTCTHVHTQMYIHVPTRTCTATETHQMCEVQCTVEVLSPHSHISKLDWIMPFSPFI